MSTQALSFEDWVERYRQHLAVLNFAPRTWITQRSYLRVFKRFLDELQVHDIQAVTASTVQDFQRRLFYQPTVRGLARTVASQNSALSTVKMFFTFLHAEGALSVNPAKEIHYARQPDPLPRNILTQQEARKIIETPDTHTLLGYRDRTILEVLYATGIRKQELMNLTVTDVNLEEELLRINAGKGGKDRVVPLSRIASRLLETYLKAIRPELLRNATSSQLFISLRARPMGKNTVGAVVEKYARLAHVKKPVTCHLWRHTCATHLLKNHANLRHVQEILGHRSLATTERYLRLTITDLKEAHRKCHPREQSLAKSD
ncbi:MAG: tyrosine-type recombinase/integrase [Gammaproteobacteria bacterium]